MARDGTVTEALRSPDLVFWTSVFQFFDRIVAKRRQTAAERHGTPGATPVGPPESPVATVRNLLTSVLDQSSTRLDSTSLRNLFYEVMAIVQYLVNNFWTRWRKENL